MKRPIRISLSLPVCSLIVSGLFAQTHAQPGSGMSAGESDPGRLGWLFEAKRRFDLCILNEDALFP